MAARILTNRKFANMPLVILLTISIGIWITTILVLDSEPKTGADSIFYYAFDFSNIHAMLSSVVTLAYPVFLRIVLRVTGNFSILPALQLAIFLASVILYYLAVTKFTRSAWLGLCASLPMLNTDFIYWSHAYILTDLLGCAMMICAMSMLFFYASDRRKIFLLMLGLFVFLAYQIRPAYLFLVVLTPCAYVVLQFLQGKPKELWRNSTNVAAVSIVPYLTFCFIRLLFIGHFGLVSFGGYNMIGVASFLINPAVVNSLSEEYAEIGQDIYTGRLERGYLPIQERVNNNLLESLLTWDDVAIQQEYGSNVWKIAIPAAIKHEYPGQSLPEDRFKLEAQSGTAKNGVLSGLSREIILLQPVYYGAWVMIQMYRGIYQTLGHRRQNIWLLGYVVAAILWRVARQGPRSLLKISPSRYGPMVVACGCFLAGMLLISLVEVPLLRYTAAVGILLPGAMLAYAYSIVTE